MKTKKIQGKSITTKGEIMIDETALFEQVSQIIESGKSRVQASVNSEVTLMFWEVGRYIKSVLLGGERDDYGKKILLTLSAKLQMKYGRHFELTNIRRMLRFAERFPDFQIVATLSPQLSWSHIVELLPLKKQEAQLFYAQEVATRRLGVRELRQAIARKAYERREIANISISEQSIIPFNIFKDPVLLDVLDLKDNYLEADLEKAILTDIQRFMLEFGRGFAFVESQKQIEYFLDTLK